MIPKPSTILILVATGLLVAACSKSLTTPAVPSYSTEYGLGPDKWATAWLLTKRQGARANLDVVEPGSQLHGIPFDASNALIRRIGDRAAFEVALDELHLNDPTLDFLARIVHEIEVNFWSFDGPQEAELIEDAYRGLQRRYGRDQVSAECYVAFFDRVYSTLRDLGERQIPLSADRLRLDCDELVEVANNRDMLVPEVPIADVLGAMAAGRRVVFVDVRERDEFAEGHIPGALNVALRDAGAHHAQQFSDAEYVVSYCVKDFRGFEMAKALADAGVKNSVIMRPYGIKGWAALGLPVTGSQALSEEAASADLAQCLAEQGDCLTERASKAQGAS
jgi:rhodanese-related sulfurtransferase